MVQLLQFDGESDESHFLQILLEKKGLLLYGAFLFLEIKWKILKMLIYYHAQKRKGGVTKNEQTPSKENEKKNIKRDGECPLTSARTYYPFDMAYLYVLWWAA